MTDLKPCPFDGADAHLIEGHRNHWRAQCTKCGANIGEFFASKSERENKADAIAAWNRRAAHPTAVDAALGGDIECSHCVGTGKIVEEARTHGANQHSACQMDCEDCGGSGRIWEADR